MNTVERSPGPIIFGAMGQVAATSEGLARDIDVIRAALAAGIEAIDTAPLYGYGRSETVIGRALDGVSSKPLVLTKVGLRWDDPKEHGEPLFQTRNADGTPLVVRKNSRPESILLEVERSCERLQVDALDWVQVHHPDRFTPFDETFGALRDLVRTKGVARVGVSNFSASQIEAARRALSPVPLSSVQSEWSALSRDAEFDSLAAARRMNMSFFAYSPLGRGLLSGRYPARRVLSPEDWRRDLPTFSRPTRFVLERALGGSVAEIARAHGASLSQVALAWALATRGVTGVIAGASSVEQVEQNAKAAQIALSLDEVMAIDWAMKPARHCAKVSAKAIAFEENAKNVVRRILRSCRDR